MMTWLGGTAALIGGAFVSGVLFGRALSPTLFGAAFILWTLYCIFA